MKLIELPYKEFIVKGNQVIKEYEEACGWIESLGLPYGRGRFGLYHELIKNSLKNIRDAENSDEKLNEFLKYLNSYAEATELIRLKNSFSSRKHEEYIDKLRQVTSGQPFRNSSKSDSSRSYGFELSIAARLINAGYKTDINQIADIVSKINGRNVYFECKRIKSAKKLRERVKSANLQLKKRLLKDKSTGARGIAALNVTDILNPQYNFVVADSNEEIKKSHSNQMNEFVISNETLLKTKASKKILGVICEYSLYGYVRNEKPFDIINCRGIKFLQYDNRPLSDKIVSEIAERISNQNIIKL